MSSKQKRPFRYLHREWPIEWPAIVTVYKKRIKDIDELRARILTAWDEMDQRIINAEIRQWRTRLRTCIKTKGGHFEHASSQ